MNEGSLFSGEMSPHHNQILPDRSMRKKLSNQRVSIALSLGE
jgi:hypothetical protein